MANVPTQFLKVAGKFGSYGEDGKPGVTFTPNISEDGILSWTNDGGLENPPPVTIKGSSGSGVYVGTEEPTDPNVNVWIDTDEEPPAEESDFIPVPETAEVGQTIVVKAVDENGKPTEWEMADMAQESEWELFKTITIEEETGEFIIGSIAESDTDELRQKQYKELTIYYYAMLSSTPSSGITITIDTNAGGAHSVINNIMNTTSNSACCLTIKRICDEFFQVIASDGGAYAKTYGITYASRRATLPSFNHPYICYLRMGVSLGVGSTVKIWGRK